ncbi:MAG: Bug family tripartite tricarboxylate transporter substrate binding protein [Xanthobacteraceae bacterium]|jgi:tripartite-type tricarboxylate transporter receptor subunit TctC
MLSMPMCGVRRKVKRVLAASAVALACASTGVQAAYPERPITFIVPFAAGGPTDIIARILATALSLSIGQNVIVDNRGGAAGNIGMGIAARATPDGYTFLLTSTAIAVNPALFRNLPYDPFKDFVPVTELVNAPNVVFVRTDSDIKTLADLIAQAKANPDKFNYASPGAGTKSHLTGELLKLRAGINMVHVPFRGGGPATQAVLAGTTQVGSVALAPVEPLVKEGQLRALAVTGAERWFSLPEIPTMVEQGFPGFVSDTFNALFAPVGTPPEMVTFMMKESRAAMQRPEARDAARKSGFEIVAGTPDELAARLATEIPMVKDLVARTGIKPE